MALYETREEIREMIIDAFDQQTGRGDFLRKLLLAGVGVGVGGAALARGGGPALAADLTPGHTRTGLPKSDLDILNYALTLEHIEATFYRTTQRPAGQVGQLVAILASDERQHVDALTAAITANGGTPVREGKYSFPPLSLPFGIEVENLGVHAYLGQAALIKTPAILLTAASIVTVEARHAAAWMTLANQDPTLGAFDGGLDMATVVSQVTPLFAK